MFLLKQCLLIVLYLLLNTIKQLHIKSYGIHVYWIVIKGELYRNLPPQFPDAMVYCRNARLWRRQIAVTQPSVSVDVTISWCLNIYTYVIVGMKYKRKFNWALVFVQKKYTCAFRNKDLLIVHATPTQYTIHL